MKISTTKTEVLCHSRIES